MKVLEASQRYLSLTGLITLDNDTSTWILALLNNLLYIILLGPALCSMTGAFVYMHSDEIVESANAIMVFCGSFMVTAMYFFLRLNRKKIIELIELLQKTVDNGLY